MNVISEKVFKQWNAAQFVHSNFPLTSGKFCCGNKAPARL